MQNKVDSSISQLEGLRTHKEEGQDRISTMERQIARLERSLASTR